MMNDEGPASYAIWEPGTIRRPDGARTACQGYRVSAGRGFRGAYQGGNAEGRMKNAESGTDEFKELKEAKGLRGGFWGSSRQSEMNEAGAYYL